MPTPRSLKDVDLAAVAHMLREPFPAAELDSVEIGDVSFGSACRARLKLRGRPDGALPRSVLLKGSFTEGLGDDEVERQWSELMRPLNAAELAFYSQYAPAMGNRVPQCYYSALAEEDGTTVLLLEDLTLRDVVFGRFDRPHTLDQQADLLDGLARLHALRWDDPVLDRTPLPDGMLSGGMLTALFSAVNWEQQRVRPRFARLPSQFDDQPLISRAIMRMWELKRARGGCLLHGDPHIGNTFQDAHGGGFFDFQLFVSGHWASDVAYCVASSLTIEDRRAHERDLLHGYLESLTKYGITAPDWDEAWLAYRRFALWGLVIVVEPGDGVQSEEYSTVVGERHAVAALDLGSLDAVLNA